jgi:phenol 2-monooxygenase
LSISIISLIFSDLQFIMASPTKTDVLIIGSGSAGLMTALWLTYYNIPFILLESRSGPLDVGQADGVQVRTVEIYESFGLSSYVLDEAYHILEVAFWGDEGQGLKRKSRAGDTERGLSHLPHVILNQARMNGLVLNLMEKRKTKEQGVVYGVKVKGVSVDEEKVGDPETHCVKVFAEKDGKEETYEARYVLGCDGAHSTVRRSLGYTMIGDTTDTVWGVMDIYPLTNFPDIRRKSTLHTSSGNLLIIPREGGDLVRFYIQLPAGTKPSAVKLEDLQSTARKIFAPYSMEFAGCDWWSAYAIGQRLASSFHSHNRVFLTGDACHTHSPKAGQGMNVSLQDGYNIGWKLGAVLSGEAKIELLETYVSERHKTAKELIDFDRQFARLFSAKETKEGEFSEFFVKSGRFTAGLGTNNGQSMVTDVEGSHGSFAKGVQVGMRMPTAQVVRFCDCKAMEFMRALRSDGRWRVVVFAGDIALPESKGRLEKVSHNTHTTTRTTADASSSFRMP